MNETIDVITLEDNQTYIITDEIIIDRVKYVIMNKEDEIEKMVIRKVNIINGKEYLVSLKDEVEVKKVLDEFIKKHHN